MYPIVAIVGMIVGFISNLYYVSSIKSFIEYLVKLLAANILLFFIYCNERKNLEFKKITRRMTAYILTSSLINISFSFFVLTNILKMLFINLSGIVCFWLIISELSEIIKIYKDYKVINPISKFNKKIELFISPILEYVEKKITND